MEKKFEQYNNMFPFHQCHRKKQLKTHFQEEGKDKTLKFKTLTCKNRIHKKFANY